MQRSIYLRRLVWGAAVVLLVFVAVAFLRYPLASLANRRARDQVATREYTKGLFWLQLSRNIHWNNSETEELLARVWRKQDQLEESRQHLDRSRLLGGATDREAWLLEAQAGNLSEAMPHLDELMQDPRDDALEIYEAYAIGMLRARNHVDIAYQFLMTWSAQQPNNPQPHYLLAKLCLEFQDVTRGVQQLRQALEVDPSHSPSAYALAQHLLSRQQPAEAWPLFQTAEWNERERQGARIGQACCLRLLGRSKEAQQILTQVLAETPESPQGNLELARLELESNQHAAALNRLKVVLQSDPNNADALQEQATALRVTGQTDEARQQFERTAMIRSRLSQARHLTRQLLVNPNNPRVRDQIGQIHLEFGDEAVGLAWLNSVLYLDPSYKPTLAVLVQHYESKPDPTGRFKELADAYRRRISPQL